MRAAHNTMDIMEELYQWSTNLLIKKRRKKWNKT